MGWGWGLGVGVGGKRNWSEPGPEERIINMFSVLRLAKKDYFLPEPNFKPTHHSPLHNFNLFAINKLCFLPVNITAVSVAKEDTKGFVGVVGGGEGYFFNFIKQLVSGEAKPLIYGILGRWKEGSSVPADGDVGKASAIRGGEY